MLQVTAAPGLVGSLRKISGPRGGGITVVLNLAAGDLFSCDGGVDRTFVCRCGTVWITRTGMTHDVVLSAGEDFVCAKDGKVVVTALERALLEVHLRRTTRWPSRLGAAVVRCVRQALRHRIPIPRRR